MCQHPSTDWCHRLLNCVGALLLVTLDDTRDDTRDNTRNDRHELLDYIVTILPTEVRNIQIIDHTGFSDHHMILNHFTLRPLGLTNNYYHSPNLTNCTYFRNDIDKLMTDFNKHQLDLQTV